MRAHSICSRPNLLEKITTTLFQDQLIEHLPRLRAFAMRLARNRALADDLVQSTALRALTNVDKFVPGTNMLAWLCTILRNVFYSELRSDKRSAFYISTEQPNRSHAAEQETRLEMRDLDRAFGELPKLQRDSLSLVGANGFSYDEAAQIIGCAIGTVKSRVCRARRELERRLPSFAASGIPEKQFAEH
jgi:RNA polymerase sigma-70 factor, ECF subfamily